MMMGTSTLLWAAIALSWSASPVESATEDPALGELALTYRAKGSKVILRGAFTFDKGNVKYPDLAVFLPSGLVRFQEDVENREELGSHSLELRVSENQVVNARVVLVPSSLQKGKWGFTAEIDDDKGTGKSSLVKQDLDIWIPLPGQKVDSAVRKVLGDARKVGTFSSITIDREATATAQIYPWPWRERTGTPKSFEGKSLQESRVKDMDVDWWRLTAYGVSPKQEAVLVYLLAFLVAVVIFSTVWLSERLGTRIYRHRTAMRVISLVALVLNLGVLAYFKDFLQSPDNAILLSLACNIAVLLLSIAGKAFASEEGVSA